MNTPEPWVGPGVAASHPVVAAGSGIIRWKSARRAGKAGTIPPGRAQDDLPPEAARMPARRRLRRSDRPPAAHPAPPRSQHGKLALGTACCPLATRADADAECLLDRPALCLHAGLQLRVRSRRVAPRSFRGAGFRTSPPSRGAASRQWSLRRRNLSRSIRRPCGEPCTPHCGRTRCRVLELRRARRECCAVPASRGTWPRNPPLYRARARIAIERSAPCPRC